jgi:hypothetical protein
MMNLVLTKSKGHWNYQQWPLKYDLNVLVKNATNEQEAIANDK